MRQERDPDAFLSRPLPAALYASAVAVIGAAALLALVRAHEDRLSRETERGEWIWYTSSIPAPLPLRFYATRDFELPTSAVRATAKVFVDRSHVLYVNGARAGGTSQRLGDPLALYEIARLLRPGVNRVAIEASSPTGIGGILFSLDLDGFGRDALVSDARWRVDLSPGAVSEGARFRPQVWGPPPQYPWGYPRMPRPRELTRSGETGAR